jgi:hypothetical protein
MENRKVVEEIEERLDAVPDDIDEDSLIIVLSPRTHERLLIEEGADPASKVTMVFDIPVRIGDDSGPRVAIVGAPP